jgi:hypothetical protein
MIGGRVIGIIRRSDCTVLHLKGTELVKGDRL